MLSPSILEALLCKTEAQQFPNHTLYVVATPIGNIADITVRALSVLTRVDAIACEDTRHSRTLLQQYGIDKPLIAAHEHNEQEAAQSIISRLQAGERISLITDAGTPAISDPGARIVHAVRAAGLSVVPIAGASAAVTALSATGVDGAFAFIGFLPNKSLARAQALTAWKHCPAHLVLYEAPHRLHDTLRALAELFPERTLTIARELTKLYEEFTQIPLHQMTAWLDSAPETRGEYVLIVHAAQADAQIESAQWQNILEILLKQLPLKQAVALTCEITHAAKNEVYAHALLIKERT